MKISEIMEQNPWWVRRPVLADYDGIFARLFRGVEPIFSKGRLLSSRKETSISFGDAVRLERQPILRIQ